MAKLDIIRAWKDAAYRNSLSESERALLPDNPAGLIELSDADLIAAGGALVGTDAAGTFGCCPTYAGTCALGTRGCCVPEPTPVPIPDPIIIA